MSVVSKNIFDLLGDDGDSSPSPAPAKAAAPAAPKKDAAPARTVPGSQPRSSGQGARGRGSYPSRGGARNTYQQGEQRNTGPVSSEGNVEGTETAGGFDGERLPPSRKGNQGSIRDAHTKGPRGNRPARGGANASRTVTSGGHSSYGSGHYRGAKVPSGAGERRVFERRNQNGGNDSQKKVDHGWGANTGEAELKDEVEGEKDAQVEENQPQTPAPEAAEEVAAPAEPQEPEEPEEVTKSYDDFLAERAQQALSIPGLEKKEARTVESNLEGTAFVRSGVEEFFSGKAKTTEAKSKAPKKEKVFIEVDGQFAQPNRPPRRENNNNREGGEQRRGGRGGARGGQRGARGGNGPRGGARGGRASANAGINANDTNAFPALGA